MRAMQSQFISRHYSCKDIKVVYDQTLVNPSDPTWAMLCAEIGKNTHPKRLDDDSLEMALPFQTHAVKILRSCQHARPMRIPRLLARVLAARGEGFVAMDRRSEAIRDLEEAIYIQAQVAKSGQQDDLKALFWFVENCLRHQLELQ